MSLRLEFNSEQVGRVLVTAIKRYPERAKKALRITAEQTAQELEEAGRADIAGAGRFGARWIFGFHAEIQEADERTAIVVYSEVPYFRIFEYGGVIKGNPLLWIPLSGTDAVGKKASEYGAPLFRVDRKTGGAPLLVASSGPKYFGKASVTMPQKFHIRDIGKRIAAKMRDYYRENWKAGED